MPIETQPEKRLWRLDGIRSSHGTILIGLYDSPESYNRAIELADKEGFLNDSHPRTTPSGASSC
jgi:hypothetical protein